MTEKHTPLPWTAELHEPVGAPGGPIWIGSRKAGYSRPKVDDVVATIEWDCSYTDNAKARRKANAALIVKAVNCHADLVAALENCRDVLGIRDDFVPLGPAVELAPVIRAALGKAK